MSLIQPKIQLKESDLAAPLYDKLFTIPNSFPRLTVSCRTTFHGWLWGNPKYRQSRAMMFRVIHNARDSECLIAKENIAELFDWVEREKLGWTERSVFSHTEDPGTLHIVLAPNWFNDSVFCSLATLFVRLGPYFNRKGNFDELLDREEWARSTKDAIHRFLDGYEKFIGPAEQQWYFYFGYNTQNKQKTMRESLVLPEGKKEPQGFFQKLASKFSA